jgi:hypothetical protein
MASEIEADLAQMEAEDAGQDEVARRLMGKAEELRAAAACDFLGGPQSGPEQQSI